MPNLRSSSTTVVGNFDDYQQHQLKNAAEKHIHRCAVQISQAKLKCLTLLSVSFFFASVYSDSGDRVSEWHKKRHGKHSKQLNGFFLLIECWNNIAMPLVEPHDNIKCYKSIVVILFVGFFSLFFFLLSSS